MLCFQLFQHSTIVLSFRKGNMLLNYPSTGSLSNVEKNARSFQGALNEEVMDTLEFLRYRNYLSVGACTGRFRSLPSAFPGPASTVNQLR